MSPARARASPRSHAAETLWELLVRACLALGDMLASGS